ncbi:MAG: hypothetical protein ACKOTE_11880, partial [Opitutaceae bacterium]
CSGVIGLWGIGFFTPELIRTVLTKTYAAQGMARGAAGQGRRNRTQARSGRAAGRREKIHRHPARGGFPPT